MYESVVLYDRTHTPSIPPAPWPTSFHHPSPLQTILRQVVERPLRLQIQSLDDMSASKERKIYELEAELSQARDDLTKREQTRVVLQAQLYETMEKVTGLTKELEEGKREIDVLKEAAQRAEKSKLAAQQTTEEMVAVVKSLRAKCEALQLELSDALREGRGWKLRAEADKAALAKASEEFAAQRQILTHAATSGSQEIAKEMQQAAEKQRTVLAQQRASSQVATKPSAPDPEP